MIGVDTSPEMLGLAREKAPEGEFYEADVHDVPLADDSVDLVVCAIVLSHVSDLAQPLGESDGNFGYMLTWSRLRK